MCQVNGKAKNSTPHCFHIFQPIFLKLKTKKDILDTTLYANFGWCGTIKMGLRKWRILAYFWFFLFCTLRVAFRSHRRTDHDQRGLKTRFSAQVPFGGLDDKKESLKVKTPKHDFGAWIGILSQICEIFKSRYLEKYKIDQHKIWRTSLEPQTGFVGGPALQNNYLKWQRPPSWIFAQRLITQLPFLS